MPLRTRASEDSATAAPDEPVRAVFEGPITALELRPPPSRVHLKILPAQEKCWVLAWAASGGAQPIARWLMEDHAFEVVREPVARRRLQAFTCKRPPDPIRELAKRFDRFDLQSSPEGKALLRLETQRGDLDDDAGFLGAACPGLSLASVEPVDGNHREAMLTQRQHDALAQALASGYYDVPRTIRLTDLADDMAMSQSSLSELLRRAERRLVETYIDRTPDPGIALGSGEIPWFSESEDGRGS